MALKIHKSMQCLIGMSPTAQRLLHVKREQEEPLPQSSMSHQRHLFQKLLLSWDENKAVLAEFYTKHLLETANAKLRPGETLYISVGSGNVCYCISNNQTDVQEEECLQLKSDHEEADTRLVCHAVHAANIGAQSVVIQSPDIDVLVLLLHHRGSIPAEQIYFATGHEGKHTSLKHFIPVHTLYELISPAKQSVIMAMYCLTGCDTVSFFFGHGNAKAFRLMQQHAEDFQALQFLGSNPDITDEERSTCTRFISMMYGQKCDSLNAVRCKLAQSERRQIVGKKLPLTDDSFFLHV